MSEYMFPPKKPAPEVSELDNTGTLLEGLFDEPTTGGEVDEILPTALHESRSITEGVSISLDERQIVLESIAKLYAQRNMGTGFHKAMKIPPKSQEFGKRYRDPETVATAMAKTAIKNDPLIQQQLSLLTKENELKGIGFRHDDVDNAAAVTAREVRNAFGEKSRYAGREKLLRPIRTASRNRHKSAA